MTGNAVIADQQQDIVDFQAGNGITIDFNSSLDRITFTANNAGYTGSIGPQGYTGSRGLRGDGGARGYTGSIGGLGFTGSQGSIGYTGSIGFAGSRGDTGYTGSAGTDGTDGANTITALTDVNISSIASFQILQYNGVTGLWENEPGPRVYEEILDGGAPGFLTGTFAFEADGGNSIIGSGDFIYDGGTA